MEHEHCVKEGDLAAIKAKVSDLEVIVKGNGLQKAVTELNILVPQLSGTVKELSGNVQMLLNRKVASDTEKNLKLTAKQKLAAIITTVISLSGVALYAIEMFLKSKG